MFFKKKYTDEVIIASLQSDDERVSRFHERHLYEHYYNLVRHGQKRYHLSESEGLDTYIDAYMALLKLIRSGDFDSHKKIAPLFKTIFDRKCVDLIRKKTNSKDKDTSSLDEVLELDGRVKSALEELITADFIANIQPLLQKIGDNCRKIIHLWSYSYSHQEIAANLATVGSAQSSKAILSKCLKKLRGELFDKGRDKV